MNPPPIGSFLLGTRDPEKLLDWYRAAFGAEPNDDGFLIFGEVALLIDKRDDVSATNAEPGRVIINFHVDDARATAARLDEIGSVWLSELEERDFGMLFGTVVDPDGNYIQIIELSDEYIESRRGAVDA